MSHTLEKLVLREILADTIRENRGAAPGDLADALLETLHTYAPKAYLDARVDVDGSPDNKYADIAREMIKTHAYDVAEWEIRATYPRLTETEAAAVNDLIGLSHLEITFS